ncbi:hypothetical protein A2U01_0038386, partial [Trifolium medium]|nr:hypothetical protein [Trifolium medium]
EDLSSLGKRARQLLPEVWFASDLSRQLSLGLARREVSGQEIVLDVRCLLDDGCL